MYLEINDYTKLEEMQKVFSDFYPFLKIEFYRMPHKKYEASDAEYLLDSKLSVGDFKPTHVSGLLEILPTYQVSEVEREFLERFGLSVQILRKEQRSWEQTTDLDDFTLRELNELSRASFEEFPGEDDVKEFDQEEETYYKFY
jgi:glycerol-3-phosphate O-acyltransferase